VARSRRKEKKVSKLESGSMKEVAALVCKKQGHRLGTLAPVSFLSSTMTMPTPGSNTVTINPTPPVEVVRCLACGATLAEIRGEE
jgi:hypothetical protein